MIFVQKDTQKQIISSLCAAGSMAFSAVLAAIMTLSLILLMHNLIYQDLAPPIDEPAMVIPDPILEERPIGTELIEEIGRPEETDPPPLSEPVEFKIDSGEINLVPAVVNVKEDFNTGINISSGSYPIAQLLSAPSYPGRALRKGIEGWVDLRYDISAFGKTENIQVIAAEPQGYFERSAIEAVGRWKYQALLDDRGEPKAFTGLSKRLVFEIEE